jgi:IS6 family transposase
MHGFRSLRSAKATLAVIETIRTIRKGQYNRGEPGVARETRFLSDFFSAAA